MMKIFLPQIILLLIFCISCPAGSDLPPAKVKGIPHEAIWVGGSDGGVWILCESIPSSANRFTCKIYNELTGDLLVGREFILRKYKWLSKLNKADYYNPGKLPENLEYESFDGEKIFIIDSYVLLPFDE